MDEKHRDADDPYQDTSLQGERVDLDERASPDIRQVSENECVEDRGVSHEMAACRCAHCGKELGAMWLASPLHFHVHYGKSTSIRTWKYIRRTGTLKGKSKQVREDIRRIEAACSVGHLLLILPKLKDDMGTYKRGRSLRKKEARRREVKEQQRQKEEGFQDDLHN